jgi:DNA-binding transcriptional LysR family regulator
VEHLRAIATFLQAAKHGNFSAAARHLHITPQAVSSQVGQLERWLDVRLFNRSTRKISLTAEGSALFERCSLGMEHIEDGVRHLREHNETAAGLVRLAAPYGLAQALIVELLPRFLERHPRISVELIVGNELPDVVGEAIDVGMVGGEVPMASLVVRRIASFQLVLCASTGYLQQHGVPQSLDDLRRHRCVNLRHHRTGKNLPWTFQRGDEVVTLDLPAAITVNDTESHRRAVLSGIGHRPARQLLRRAARAFGPVAAAGPPQPRQHPDRPVPVPAHPPAHAAQEPPAGRFPVRRAERPPRPASRRPRPRPCSASTGGLGDRKPERGRTADREVRERKTETTRKKFPRFPSDSD